MVFSVEASAALCCASGPSHYLSRRGRKRGGGGWRKKYFWCQKISGPQPDAIHVFPVPPSFVLKNWRTPFKLNTKIWKIKVSYFLLKTPLPPSFLLNFQGTPCFAKKKIEGLLFSPPPSDVNNDWSLSLEPPVVLTMEDLCLPVSSFTSAGIHVLVCVVLCLIKFSCASGQFVVNYMN